MQDVEAQGVTNGYIQRQGGKVCQVL